MTDVMTVRAGCDACALTLTAVVVDDTIPPDVADFFRVHAAHAVTGPAMTPAPRRWLPRISQVSRSR